MESLAELFHSRVSKTPKAIALVSDGAELSYADLDRVVELATDRLAAAGVRPGDLIGLLVERDTDTVVWLLAILRHAAAYVPLDPSYPQERLRFIAADSGLDFVVGTQATAERAGLSTLRVIDPKRSSNEVVPPRASGPAPTAASMAYILYTSGSTGRPKGCVITHGNVLAFIDGGISQFNLTADDRWALFHSLCFDFSVWELWGALSTGATAVMVPWQTALSADDLIEFLQEQWITVLSQVPSVFQYTAQAHADSGYPPLHLRYLCFGGERMNLDTVRDFVDGAGTRAPQIVNMYGPTETTVVVTAKAIDAETLRSAPASASPIGRPLPHVGAHVLTPEGEPVPDGTDGELWLSGPSVSVGYLGRDDLNAERFRELPLGPGSGMLRCYRTGDVVRLLPDGGIGFLGRNDDQVKIRGFRVELREIELGLNLHPSVRDSAVCVVDTAVGPELAACVMAENTGSEVLPESIKELLKRSLPAHMVPRRYVVVDRLPLTPGGKVDRPAVVSLFSGD
ncbi:MAG: amino acid adenylation domain-containing protein [Pseudonocardiaceae bacterium]